jgi:hypothetical protein
LDPVDTLDLSPVCIPCENGSTITEKGFLHGVHTPYDYDEVLND